MTKHVSNVSGRMLFAAVAFAASVSAATAQTTVTLNQSKSQVVYATLRSGAYANKNYPTNMTTRAADSTDQQRRAMIKFDTQNYVPAGASVSSALMTLTVKGGSAVKIEGSSTEVN